MSDGRVFALYIVLMVGIGLPTIGAFVIGARIFESGHPVIGLVIALAGALWFLGLWFTVFSPSDSRGQE